MALMRTGRKMMMGDPPNLPKRPQDVKKAMSDLQQVKISGPSDDPFVGTFARKGDIAETSARNKSENERYRLEQGEYDRQRKHQESYFKQKTAYDKYVSNKPKRKAKGTLEDMTEEQHTAVYGIGTLTGQDRADYLKANPDRARDVLPNENIRIYGYKEAMEQKKKTGKFDPYYEAQAFTDEHIAAGYIPGGRIGKTKRPYTSESTWNDPGPEPAFTAKYPEQPKLVQPKTTTVGKIKKDEVESWSSPTRTKGGGSKLMTQKIPVKKSTSERQKGYTYGKERKMAAAYYGAVGDVLGEEGRYATSGALGDFQKTRKEDIKGLKQQKKEAIARQDKKDIKEGIKSSRKDIREAKLAQKYVESLPNRYQSMSGVSKGDIRRNVENEKLPEGKNKPKRVVRTFTPEAMKGSTEQARQSMLTETKKVRNLGPTKRTMPKNR